MFDPKIIITPAILRSIGQIEAAKSVIENSPLLPTYERQFKTEATARRVHFSTAIEGNYLALAEVKKMIDTPYIENSVTSVDGYLKANNDVHGQEIIARHRDIHEVINYRDVVKYIESLIRNLKEEGKVFKLSEKVIFDIHKILLKNILECESGTYRDKMAISVNFLTGEKVYPYEHVDNVIASIKDLLVWYNNSNDIHPVIKAGILHLEFVRIHPFIEGNGRLARALATLSLSVDKYSVNQFFCLDEYYDNDAKDYYEHLQKGFNQISDWLEYFCLGMSIEFNRIKDRVIKISKDAKIKEKTGQLFITDRQEEIVEWINNYGFFRNSDFEVLFPKVSEDTVLRELKGLIDGGVIAKVGKTKSARYELVK